MKINVASLTKEQAVDFILNSCRDCDNKFYCNGADAKECNDKKEYLVNKYKKNKENDNEN